MDLEKITFKGVQMNVVQICVVVKTGTTVWTCTVKQVHNEK